MSGDDFRELVRSAIGKTPVVHLSQTSAAVVLERLARGGGATNWYYCRVPEDLTLIETHLSPGSVVSFYFDQRFQFRAVSASAMLEIQQIIDNTSDAVVGIVYPREVRLNAEVVVGANDLKDFFSSIPAQSQLCYGAFPGRDNDGIRAVTLTLPDRDGVIRAHPH